MLMEIGHPAPWREQFHFTLSNFFTPLAPVSGGRRRRDATVLGTLTISCPHSLSLFLFNIIYSVVLNATLIYSNTSPDKSTSTNPRTPTTHSAEPHPPVCVAGGGCFIVMGPPSPLTCISSYLPLIDTFRWAINTFDSTHVVAQGDFSAHAI